MILYVYTRPIYLISRACVCLLSLFECFSSFYSRAERLSSHTTPFDFFFTKRTDELRRKNVFSASSSIVVGFVVLDFLLKRLQENDDDDARDDNSSNNDNIFFFFFNITIAVKIMVKGRGKLVFCFRDRSKTNL